MSTVVIQPGPGIERQSGIKQSVSDILNRRQTHFILWCPEPASRPELIIGTLENGNPPAFKQLDGRFLFQPVQDVPGLWELAASGCSLANGAVYHYWIEVDNSLKPTQRIKVTDPFAYCVDYRLAPPDDPLCTNRPASVIGWFNGKLVACDPNGEQGTPEMTPFERLPYNNQMVIYEMPTAWSKTCGNDEFERANGTFRDVRALIEKDATGANFPGLNVTREGSSYLTELGINALEMLPPSDSIYSREWGYGTSHYLAPDYELGYPEGHLSPTPNQDLTALINSCHKNGIRVILDVVLGFMKDDPYRHIDLKDFYLEDPARHTGDPNAYSSRDKQGGGKELRSSYGASSPRYIASKSTYDPMSGTVKDIAPARQYMLAFLTRWMQDFQIDGIRMDSVETVANWEFIQAFRDEAHKQFKNRYDTVGDEAKDKFIVVGEELTMPYELLTQNRLDGLWNERFQGFIRAALLGQNAENEPSFEWTVRRAIDCKIDGLKGSQVINYLTSHDVEGTRKERLYNMMESAITLENSGSLFDRGRIEARVREEIKNQGGNPTYGEVKSRTDQKILHLARLGRIKLAFVCLLTSVGIPMILAGEEFGDQNDLFDKHGNVTHQGGKQVDPVNYSRRDEPDRNDLLEYVKRLVKLRTSHPAFMSDEIDFIHTDFNEGKRVVVWKRGTTNPVVVVANFSGYITPDANNGKAEYRVPNWPSTPEGFGWVEETQSSKTVKGWESREVKKGWEGREPIFAWEAKVYHLKPLESPGATK